MTLQELQVQICQLPLADRLSLLNALVQSLQNELQPAVGRPAPLASAIGMAQGSFPSAEAADQFVRQERDRWES